MPRPNRGPHLYFNPQRGVYYIRWYAGGKHTMQTTGTAILDEAEKALARFKQFGAYRLVPERVKPGVSYVYFIGGDDGPIKIGVSVDPQARLSSLQIGSPVPLKILATGEGDKAHEWMLHNVMFHAHRLHGEWFARHPDILAEIDRLNTPERSVA